jgi:hypothetical protein
VKVVVYQVGKVGSASIYQTLISQGFTGCSDSLEGTNTFFASNKSVMHTHSLGALSHILRICSTQNLKVVIVFGTRDMLDRHISAFFQNISNFGHDPWYIHNWQNKRIEEIINFFDSKIIRHAFTVRHWLARFFEMIQLEKSEMMAITTDIQTKGYSMVKTKSFSLVGYRLEKLSQAWTKLIQPEITPNNNTSLLITNQGCSKQTNELYKEFKSTYKPSELVIREAYSSDLSRCLYLPSEILEQTSRWYD